MRYFHPFILLLGPFYSRLCNSPGEVVSEALRRFFMDDDELTPKKIAWLNAIIEKQEEGIRNGSEQWIDGEAFFKDMKQKYS
jgi:hypothetical protein